MDKNKPANIKFDEDRSGVDGGDDDIQILDDDFDSPPSRVSTVTAKKKGAPLWIFMVGGGILLAAVVGGGMMVASMMNRTSSRDEVMLPPSQPITQPVIQPQNYRDSSEKSASGVPSALPLQEMPAGAGNIEVHAPQPAAQLAPGQPLAVSVSPLPPAGPSVVQVQAPAGLSQSDAKMTIMEDKLSRVEDKLSRVVSSLDGVSRRLDESNGKLAKLEAELTALKSKAATAKAEPQPEQKKTVQAPAPVKVLSKKELKPVVAKPVKPEPPAGPQAQAKDRAGESANEKLPSEGISVVATAPAKIQGWSILSIIGSRAWLVKRNADGTEIELSIAPGEKIEGKLVTSVDGNSKFVMLEGGQKIGVGK